VIFAKSGTTLPQIALPVMMAGNLAAENVSYLALAVDNVKY